MRLIQYVFVVQLNLNIDKYLRQGYEGCRLSAEISHGVS